MIFGLFCFEIFMPILLRREKNLFDNENLYRCFFDYFSRPCAMDRLDAIESNLNCVSHSKTLFSRCIFCHNNYYVVFRCCIEYRIVKNRMIFCIFFKYTIWNCYLNCFLLIIIFLTSKRSTGVWTHPMLFLVKKFVLCQ